MSKTLISHTCEMTDSRGNACGKPARRAFTISVPLDTKSKKLVFWCCDLHCEAFEAKFPRGRLEKITVDEPGFVVDEE